MKNLYSKIIILSLAFIGIQPIFGMDSNGHQIIKKPIVYGEVSINPNDIACVATKYYYQQMLNIKEEKVKYELLIPVQIGIFEDQNSRKNSSLWNSTLKPVIDEIKGITPPKGLPFSALINPENNDRYKEGDNVILELEKCKFELTIKSSKDHNFDTLLNKKIEDFKNNKNKSLIAPFMWTMSLKTPQNYNQIQELIAAEIIKKEGDDKFVHGEKSPIVEIENKRLLSKNDTSDQQQQINKTETKQITFKLPEAKVNSILSPLTQSISKKPTSKGKVSFSSVEAMDFDGKKSFSVTIKKGDGSTFDEVLDEEHIDKLHKGEKLTLEYHDYVLELDKDDADFDKKYNEIYTEAKIETKKTGTESTDTVEYTKKIEPKDDDSDNESDCSTLEDEVPVSAATNDNTKKTNLSSDFHNSGVSHGNGTKTSDNTIKKITLEMPIHTYRDNGTVNNENTSEGTVSIIDYNTEERLSGNGQELIKKIYVKVEIKTTDTLYTGILQLGDIKSLLDKKTVLVKCNKVIIKLKSSEKLEADYKEIEKKLEEENILINNPSDNSDSKENKKPNQESNIGLLSNLFSKIGKHPWIAGGLTLGAIATTAVVCKAWLSGRGIFDYFFDLSPEVIKRNIIKLKKFI